MYDTLDAVGLAEASAQGIAMEDRLRYAPFFEAAERLAHNRGLIVGGGVATLLLLGEPLGPNDFHYELYSSAALNDARALTDALYAAAPEGLGHYTNMRTEVPHQEFVISVDERLLFRVKALATHRGARAADIIVPSERPAFFARDRGEPLPLRCMGPEIQLMAVYAALSNPARAGDWGGLLRAEVRLRALFDAEIRGKIETATRETRAGGAERGAASLRQALLKEYVPRSGHVLVSPRAEGRLQIVTANSLRDEEIAISRIARRLGFTVQSATNEPKVPTDARLRRLTMYHVPSGARREPFIDVFNSGEYEVVPFEKSPAPRTGTFFVLLRYRLVDVWTIQLLFRMGATSADYTRGVLEALVADFDKIAGEYSAALAQSTSPEDFARLLPVDPESYIGRYEDPAVFLKRQKLTRFTPGRQRGQFFPPYFPARASRGEEAGSDNSDKQQKPARSAPGRQRDSADAD